MSQVPSDRYCTPSDCASVCPCISSAAHHGSVCHVQANCGTAYVAPEPQSRRVSAIIPLSILSLSGAYLEGTELATPPPKLSKHKPYTHGRL